jgi:CrcB protein
VTALLLVCAGAAVGAPARYLTDRAVQSRHDSLVPWGTLAVNVVGSLVLGVVTGLAVAHDLPEAVTLGVGTGFCGALTTYSTFSYETLRLLESRAVLVAVLNVGISLVAGLAAALVGYALGTAL